MGKRLRLAQALADDLLIGEELRIAKGNRIVVQEAERIKRETHVKEKKMKSSEIRKVVKNGR